MTTTKSTHETQSQRRVKYGLNVFVAVIAAAAIAVMINWISYRNFRAGAVRWDLTSTRQYSLSPLTRKVLDRFESDYQIVTLLDPSENAREDTQRARDLVEEYARIGRNLRVEHINPATELTRREAFEKSLHQKFAGKFDDLDRINKRGIEAMSAARGELIEQLNILRDLLKNKALKPGDTLLRLRETERFLEAQSEGVGKAIKVVSDYKAMPLPPYGTVRGQLKDLFEALDNGFYPQIQKTRITPVIELAAREYPKAQFPRTAGDVEEAMLAINNLITRGTESRKAVIADLVRVQPVPSYEALIAKLKQPNPIVIVAPKDVWALNLTELFRSPTQAANPEQRESTEHLVEKQFLGEERLTGALARMTVTQLDPPPMVVFVSTGTLPGTKPNRDYKQVLDRLTSMGIQVEVWEPIKSSPFADPRGINLAPPKPKDNQRVVWVILPGDPVDPNNPLSQSTAKANIGVIRDRMISHSDGVLAIMSPEIDAPQVQKQILEDWRIEVDFQYVVLREIVDRYGQNQPYNYHDVRAWPEQSPVSRAVAEAGMIGVFSWCSPIRSPATTERAAYKPLVELTAKNMWANFNTGDESNSGPPKLDKAGDKPGDRFTIAVSGERAGSSAEKAPQRIVVFADRLFATDRFGSEEFADPVTKRSVQITRFPANHELFINSVYWLTGLDELIAAGARTQDVRRVGAMSTGEVKSLQWTLMLGMPLGTLIIGVAVWFTRRG